MNGSFRCGVKPALWLVMTLLLTLFIALPAHAAVTGLSVSADNPTTYVKTNYTLSCGVDANLNVDDLVNVYVNSNFNISQVTPSDVQLTVNGQVYSGAVTVSSSSNQITIPVNQAVNVGDPIQITINGVKNPSFSSNSFSLGYVDINGSSSVYIPGVTIYNPTLTVTPQYNTIEVNLRDKLTLALKDHNGNPFNVPYAMTLYFYTTSGSGEFYAQPADVSSTSYATIPADSSSVDVYLRPTNTGSCQVYAYTSSYLYLSANSPVITVTPASAVSADVFKINYYNDFVAGTKGKMQVQIYDQYWHPVPQTADLTVNLQVASGTFYQADASGNATTTAITSVVIPAGQSSANFYYYNTEANIDVSIECSAGNLDNYSQVVHIYPAQSTKLVLTATDTPKLAGESCQLKVQLQDQYGNLANPQYGPLTVDLKTTSANGRFYSDTYSTGQITQLTFNYGWYGYESAKTFYYVDTTSGNPTVSTEVYYLQNGQVNIKVLPVPESISITTQSGDWLVNQRGKVNIALKNADSSAYSVPAELTGGLAVALSADSSGVFYDSQVGGNKLYYSYNYVDGEYCYSININIPSGKDNIDIYFAPVAGVNNLTANVSNHSEISTGTATINASTAGGVRAVLSGCLNFTASKAGELTVTVLDQYNNAVTQDKDLAINLYTQTGDGSPSATGKFYAAVNADGTPAGSAISSVVIADGSVSAYVYFCDTKSTDYNYSLKLGTKSLEVDGTLVGVSVSPASSTKLDVKIFDYPEYNNLKLYNNGYTGSWGVPGTDGTQSNLLSGTVFPMDVSILDSNNNPVSQSSTLTINLSSLSDTVYGKFYSDEDCTQPVTQITFNTYYSGVKHLYFKADGIGQATVKATAPGLADCTIAVNVINADRLAIHFPLYWTYDETLKKMMLKEDKNVQPEGRKPFCVILSDAYGHPAVASNDVTVNLSGGSFYKSDYDANAITSVAIPAGYQGVVVYMEAPSTTGSVSVSATASGLTDTGNVAVNVGLYPYYYTSLARGWNTLSTPAYLEYKAMDQVINDVGSIANAYTYDEVQGKWLQIYSSNSKWYIQQGTSDAISDPEFTFQPQHAIFVKMKGESYAHYYASSSVNVPPTRQLVAGWNLISPAIDTYDYYYDDDYYGYYGAMSVNKVLSSIDGQYSQVISPPLHQASWAYVPSVGQQSYVPYMQAGLGYWVYMKQAGTLAGFSTTPVNYGSYGSYSNGGGGSSQY